MQLSEAEDEAVDLGDPSSWKSRLQLAGATAGISTPKQLRGRRVWYKGKKRKIGKVKIILHLDSTAVSMDTLGARL
jgi:hypothetical protein